MAALERSSLGLMCTRIFTWWWCRRAGATPSPRSVSALGSQAQEPGRRSLRGLWGVRVWFYAAAQLECAGDPLSRGLSAKVGWAQQASKDRWAGCQSALLKVGPFCPRQSWCAGAGTRAYGKRRTASRVAPAAGAIGQSEETTRSPRAQSLGVNHGFEPVKSWWKPRTFAALDVPQWIRELLQNSQSILLALQQKIGALTIQLQSAAAPNQPRGLGLMTSVIIDREIGDWRRFSNRRQIASYTGLCPGEYSSGNPAAKLRDQARQSALACCAGGIGLASGALPAQLQTDREMASNPG